MPTPLPTRFTALLLAALVTGTLLGSIDLMAAERYVAARMSQQQVQADQQLAAAAACRIGG